MGENFTQNSQLSGPQFFLLVSYTEEVHVLRFVHGVVGLAAKFISPFFSAVFSFCTPTLYSFVSFQFKRREAKFVANAIQTHLLI